MMSEIQRQFASGFWKSGFWHSTVYKFIIKRSYLFFLLKFWTSGCLDFRQIQFLDVRFFGHLLHSEHLLTGLVRYSDALNKLRILNIVQNPDILTSLDRFQLKQIMYI